MTDCYGSKIHPLIPMLSGCPVHSAKSFMRKLGKLELALLADESSEKRRISGLANHPVAHFRDDDVERNEGQTT